MKGQLLLQVPEAPSTGWGWLWLILRPKSPHHEGKFSMGFLNGVDLEQVSCKKREETCKENNSRKCGC
jgi:hypothetical protein